MPCRTHPAARWRRPAVALCATLASALTFGGCGAPPSDGTNETQPAAADPGRVDARDLDLQARLTERLDALDAVATLYAKHLPSGREVAIRADVPMNTLSVIKIPVMVQAFVDHQAGRLDLDARHRVMPDEMRRGSGLVQTFATGLEPTGRDLLRQMIITSDNTATDIMIDAVGLERVNAMLADRGYADTRLRMTTGELFREVWVRADPAHAALTDREVFERGFPSDADASARSFALEGDSTRWLGRTTAREMARLLEEILGDSLGSPEASAEMIDMLSGQFYASRLPQRVRWQGVGVAHKTGDWPPFAGNDVGILFYEGGPTVVAVFTNQNRGDFFDLEATLGLVAQDLVEAWR